jgi:serine/threonine protein phosphatase PrpC
LLAEQENASADPNQPPQEDSDDDDNYEEGADKTVQTRSMRAAWHEEDEEQEATLRLDFSIGLDPGLVRKDRPNEDSIFAIQGIRTTSSGPVPAGLFVVADGMGGHANGRDASRLATRTISDIIVPTLSHDESEDEEDEQELLQDLLKDGVHRANLAIYQRNREAPDMMGTTITAALIVNTTAYVVNVGDSRTYLYRADIGLNPITRDHSHVANLVKAGEIKPDEIYTHPQRNQIYRCLGEHATVEADTFTVPLQPDDILLLCSDGLWEMVRDPAMEKIIASSSHLPAQISNILVQAALNHGGADNISVIVVGIVKTTL